MPARNFLIIRSMVSPCSADFHSAKVARLMSPDFIRSL